MRWDSGAGMAPVRVLLFLRQEGEVVLHAAADVSRASVERVATGSRRAQARSQVWDVRPALIDE